MPRQKIKPYKKYEKIPYSDNLIERFLKEVKENPTLSLSEIAKKLNCSYQTVKNLKSYLTKFKLVPPSLTLKYPEKEYREIEEKEVNEIEKLKEENEELKEKVKTYEEQLNRINLNIINRIAFLEPLITEEEIKIKNLETKIRNEYDYKERLNLIERLQEHKLNYAKLIKEIETLKSFLKSK